VQPESVFFSSIPLFEYALVVFLFFHFFVLLYEENVLRRTFGAEYEQYCVAVPRWGISFRPYQ
jgi:protein-S-isoprenylcysteine O-methyltransferase Ste14